MEQSVVNAPLDQHPTAKPRNYRVDNIRFILIFLIVFGHFLETFEGPIKQNIYTIIYSFHVPAFIILSGLYAKYSPKRLFTRYIGTYLVFQLIYLIFDAYINNHDATIQFSTPYWLLWYLMALILYQFLIPTIDAISKKKVLIGSFILALLVGLDSTFAYYLSISGTLVFLPFFVLGYYCKGDGIEHVMNFFTGKRKRFLDLACILIALLEVLFMFQDYPEKHLQGGSGYGLSFIGTALRIGFFACALCWILVLFCSIPNKRIPLLSKAGSYTMCVYLMHGFVKLLMQRYNWLDFPEPVNILISFIGALALVFLGCALTEIWRKARAKIKKMMNITNS